MIVAMTGPMLVATPAGAATGNGTSVGTYTINSTGTGQGICSVVYDYSYASGPGYTGSYTAVTVPGPGPGLQTNTFTGPLTVAWTAAKAYTYNGVAVVGFENPVGQFMNPACTIPAPPWTFSANTPPPTPTVSGSIATPSSSVSCIYSGTHSRTVAATETTFDGTCTVTSGGTTSSTATREVHVGEVLNCDESDGDPPPEACHENDTWVAAA